MEPIHVFQFSRQTFLAAHSTRLRLVSRKSRSQARVKDTGTIRQSVPYFARIAVVKNRIVRIGSCRTERSSRRLLMQATPLTRGRSIQATKEWLPGRELHLRTD